jgi:hypothetical protein
MKSPAQWSQTTRVVAAFTALVMLAALSVIWEAVTDKAFAVPPSVTETEPAPKTAPAKKWPKKMNRKLHAGKLKSSNNRSVKGKISKRLNKYESHHPKLDKWWYNDGDYELTDAACILNGFVITYPFGLPSLPIVMCTAVGEKPSIQKINKDITHTWVTCGGQAALAVSGGGLFGFVAKKAVGAVIGGVVAGGWEGTGCAFEKMADKLLQMENNN